MRRAVSLLLLGALAVGGITAGVVAPGGGASPRSSSAVYRITVTASEFKFVLSKRSVPTTGTVIFTVVNRGKISHDFKIFGKKTPILNPGQKATLTVKFTKKSRYSYICTVPGHAKLGMKGVFAVGFTTAVPSGVTRIAVAASEFKFVLSKRSVPAGTTVVFTVVNKGKISHDFKILTKKTPILNPGQKATLIVKFTKAGRYTYICTVPGHVKLGMKGVFSVGVKPPTITPGTTSTAPPATTNAPPAPPPGPVGTAQTTVQVGMFEYRFDLSQATVPSGQVTFVITNKGSEVHNFAITGGRSGALLAPGKSETWTVGLPAGTYTYVCEVPFHVERGMIGQLTVTP